MTKDLFDLPRELWMQIFSNLDAISLAQCAMTCKHIYETFKSSSQLLYIVQLHLDGLKDAGNSTPHSELIQHLLRHRNAWLSLTPRARLEYVALEMKHSCRAYEFVGGVFADTDRRHLEIVWLPTSNSGSRTLRRTLSGMSVRDFAMDPTQDLIVLLEDKAIPSLLMPTRTLRVHIRTLSTNDTHPLARQSPLCFTLPPDPVNSIVIYSAVLQIARNILTLYFCTQPRIQPCVHIWDWTTSSLLVDCSTPFDPLLSSLPYDFGLLDSTFCFTTRQAGSGSIRLYELGRPPVAHGPIHLATLRLPPTRSGNYIYVITAHAGPIEANPLPHTPFMMNDEDRLHVFTIVYPQSENTSLNMFVHQRVFTKYCMQGKQRRHADP
ncbi:hypothetical protein BJ912DRAFT_110485 [Pholiota molesta]|nr:hypothetical protein BJ912DRAFT_110485 [Pholiota molesta]